MNINWEVNSTTVLNCLKEARDTFYQLIEDLDVTINPTDDLVLQEYWNDTEAYKYVQYVEIQSLRAYQAHTGDFFKQHKK